MSVRGHMRGHYAPPAKPTVEVPAWSLTVALLVIAATFAALLLLPEAQAGLAAVAEWVRS